MLRFRTGSVRAGAGESPIAPRALTFHHGLLAAGTLVLAIPVCASVSGVVQSLEGTPIGGAQVRLQTSASPIAISAADGSFTLPVTFTGTVTVSASVPYVVGTPPHYATGGQPDVSDGRTDVLIELEALPTTSGDPLSLPRSEDCGSCHTEQYDQWSTSAHARAANDEWVLDLFSGTGTPGGSAGYVFKNLHDPGETGFCATCHAALQDVTTPGQLMLDAVTSPAAQDGVGCLTCHQIQDVNTNVSALHHLGNASYRFPDGINSNTWQYVWGPLPDVTSVMRNSEAAIFTNSRFCASCHEYENPSTHAAGQTTYSEWSASSYAVPGPGFKSCQDCHMPAADTPGPLSLLGTPVRPGNQRHAHSFEGATLARLQAALQLTASAAEVAGQVRVDAAVANLGAGHAFPTGISIRNALLVISASRGGVPLTQAWGPTIPFWGSDDVPGQQPGDYAGQPGKGFARIMEGRINGAGPVVRPVLFIDAENVFSNTLIQAGQTDSTQLAFSFPPGAQPGDLIDVTVRLLYRRAFRATAVTKGWTQTPQGGPIEVEVARRDLQVQLTTPVELERFSIQ